MNLVARKFAALGAGCRAAEHGNAGLADAAKPAERYTRVPAGVDGIGKRYMGRDIAGVDGVAGRRVARA